METARASEAEKLGLELAALIDWRAFKASDPSLSSLATGVLMATTMLIIPAVTALLPAQRMKQVWPLAALFGVVPVVLGLHLSLLLDMPASAIIVALSFLLLLPVLAFSSSRRG